MNTKHIRRTAATVLGATAAAFLLGSAPASAASSFVEADSVTQSTANGSARSTVVWFYDDTTHTLRGTVSGKVTRVAGADTACVFVIADWFYADGTHLQTAAPYSASASGPRMRACNDGFVDPNTGTNTRSFEQSSQANKDVVSVKLYLRNSADPTSGGTTVKNTTALLGDAPDSLGTTEQLDVDPTAISISGQPVLTNNASGTVRAATKYSLTPSATAGQFDIRARVTGVLQFNDVIPGTSVTAKVVYHTDAGDVNGGTYVVNRGGGSRAISEVSPTGKDTRSVTISLFDNQGRSLGSVDSRMNT